MKETLNVESAPPVDGTHEEVSSTGFVPDQRSSALSSIFSLLESRIAGAFLNLLAGAILVLTARTALTHELIFDDAYMFQRYAIHVWQGLGVSWNPDGVHTAGMTSLGWFIVVLPVSLLPLWQGKVLAFASVLAGTGGLVLASVFVSRLSQFHFFRRFWFVFPVTVILLAGSSTFRNNMRSGMDTMLSFAVNLALCGSVWAWVERPGTRINWSVCVGLAGAAAVITRPENGLLAVFAPLLAAVLLLDRTRRREYLAALISFALALLAYLVIYRWYFHTFLPLSFYMKSQHPYRGYTGVWKWSPAEFTKEFILLVLPVVILPVAFWARGSLRIASTFLLPTLLTFFYLGTVMQIMGEDARYYVPFSAPVLIAAFWMTGNAVPQHWRWRRTVSALGAFGVLMVIALAGIREASARRIASGKLAQAYPSPVLVMPSNRDLPPRPWLEAILVLSHDVISRLPAGSTIAASEVGFIGAAAPRVGIIDLAGLNDTDIALHGFTMNRLLDRKPALIWFPHRDYTWQRQAMFCSARLLEDYVLIGGNAFGYSLAIRKDDPGFALLRNNVTEAFNQEYPGQEIEKYIVTGIDTTGVCPKE